MRPGLNKEIVRGRTAYRVGRVTVDVLLVLQWLGTLVSLTIDPQRPALFAMQVSGITIAGAAGIAVRIDFQAVVAKEGHDMPQSKVLSEAQFLHNVILEQFEAMFTPEAKRTFEPV